MGCGPSNSKPKEDKPLPKDIVDYNNFINEIKQYPAQEYKFGKMLGEGTYGVVIKCEFKGTGEIRAMKKIPKKTLSKDEQRMRMVNDIQILQSLTHPNIVRVYEYYQDESNFYVVQEFIKGGELFERFEQLDHLSEREAANVMKQVLSVLKYCHRQGICHRDLKPENIMIDQKEQVNGEYDVKVIDWGCAKRFGKEKLTDLVGTPYYIAPEVVNRSYDEKCDLWSIGAILFTLLCGEPPFLGESVQDVLGKVAKGEYHMDGPIWQSISEDAKDLIRNLMCYNSQKRFSADQALQHRWMKNAPEAQIDEKLRKQCWQNIQNFRAKTNFSKAIISYMVSQIISQDSLAQYQKLFKTMDKNNDGTISKQELKNYFANTTTNDKLEQVLKIIDTNQNGQINYNEFLAAFMDNQKFTSEQILKQAFNKLDKDQSGYITADEMGIVLKSGIKSDQPNDPSWQHLLNQVDKNGDGKISFDEFKLMIQKAM